MRKLTRDPDVAAWTNCHSQSTVIVGDVATVSITGHCNELSIKSGDEKILRTR